MYRINDLFTTKRISVFISIFLVIAIIIFIVFQGDNSDTPEELIHKIYLISISLTFLFVFSLLSLIMIAKREFRKISKDTQEITEYLQSVSEKNYDAQVKIKHFHEYLHISVLLKNLVKRVNNKEKKRSK